jgi:hypothetical protein
MLTIIFGMINLSFAFLIFFLTLAFVTGAPFVPSTNIVTQKMIELSQLKSGMTIYDLGSGDGRLLFAAAEKGVNAIGYEINPFLVLLTNIRKLFSSKRSLIHIYWKNFWNADLKDADVVYVYLLPWRMEKLKHLLSKQLKSGSLVVSNSFIFPNWTISNKDSLCHVYVFKMILS